MFSEIPFSPSCGAWIYENGSSSRPSLRAGIGHASWEKKKKERVMDREALIRRENRVASLTMQRDLGVSVFDRAAMVRFAELGSFMRGYGFCFSVGGFRKA